MYCSTMDIAVFASAERSLQLALLSPGSAIALTLLFLVLSGFLVAFLKAIRVLSPLRLQENAEAGNRNARTLMRRMEDPAKFHREVMTARIILATAYFVWNAIYTVPLIIDLFDNLSLSAAKGWIAFAFFALLTLLFLIFGYSIPERVSGGKDGLFAIRYGFLVSPLLLLARPIECFVHASGNLILKLFGIREVETADFAPTEQEFLQMLETGHAKGMIEDDNRELIANLFDFDDKIAAEIMTHRTEIEALPIESGYDETMSFLYSTKYTRFPVYKGTVDNVIGVLHVKDLLFHKGEINQGYEFSLAEIMRPAWFTPESRNISDLFHDMQQNHIQMAIVIDEYGGTAGLLTIEDLVEQIVGNIEDEYDEAEQEMIEIAPGTWLVDGTYPIDRLSRVTGISFVEDEYDTVAGFVIELLDRIPEEHERPSVRYGPLTFYVLAIADNRIVRVRVTRSDMWEGDDE